MKHALRLYWLVKGKQDYQIGDKLETESDEVGIDFQYLNWFFNSHDLARDIIDEFGCMERIGSANMMNSNIYLTNQSKTILGIIPINKVEVSK